MLGNDKNPFGRHFAEPHALLKPAVAIRRKVMVGRSPQRDAEAVQVISSTSPCHPLCHRASSMQSWERLCCGAGRAGRVPVAMEMQSDVFGK